MDRSTRARRDHRSGTTSGEHGRPDPTTHVGLGVLAHVDAGKTSLTEALLVAGGALAHVGRVDDGTTQTDTLALERRRGITIRAAVATFGWRDVVVDLIDTPGHPDFIAEVDRSLAVLDGAVLVVSAVEGVQAQTLVLQRALRRLRVPTVVFVNKVDRPGADPARVVADLRERLEADLLALGSVLDAGEPRARFVADDWDEPAVAERVTEVLAAHDDAVLARWVEGGRPPTARLRAALGRLTRAGTLHPVLLGSARTGTGVAELVDIVTDLLRPPRRPDPDAPLVGQVFKVEHDEAGRRVCTVRLRSGRLAVRDRVPLGGDRTGTVTALAVHEPGGPVPGDHAVAGQVVRVLGLAEARVGDVLGTGSARPPRAAFPPPALQTTVTARDPARQGDLHRALAALADVDPLIRVRPDARTGALRIDVYGEVQREVLAETLVTDHGLKADFSEPEPACLERVVRSGTAVRRIGDEGHHRVVTLGVAVAPLPPGSGAEVVVCAERLTLPLHVYGTVEALRAALEAQLGAVLEVGPQGWPVVDVRVTVTESGYRPPGPSPADVRHTFATVVAEALRLAGTVVCEPVDRFRVVAPTATLTSVSGLLLRHRGSLDGAEPHGATTVVSGTLPSVEADAVRRALPTAAHGLAVLESALDHHAPRRVPRTDDSGRAVPDFT